MFSLWRGIFSLWTKSHNLLFESVSLEQIVITRHKAATCCYNSCVAPVCHSQAHNNVLSFTFSSSSNALSFTWISPISCLISVVTFSSTASQVMISYKSFQTFSIFFSLLVIPRFFCLSLSWFYFSFAEDEGYLLQVLTKQF